MVKVYLATTGEYSDYRVVRVFANRADAEAYPIADDIEEYELTEGPVDVRPWHEITWRLNDREPEQTHELRDFDGHPNNCIHRLCSSYGRPHALTVEGWDLTRVQKVFSEQRAQYVAMQDLKRAQRDAEVAEQVAMMGTLYVQVTHTEYADAALRTPLHKAGRGLLVPSDRVREQAGLEPGAPLPGRWFTVQTLTLDTADGFSVSEGPERGGLA